MQYPDFKYVEVAVNGAHNRNNLADIRAVKHYIGHTEAYMTFFRYNEEIVDHFQEKQTVKGYQGNAYADWLPIDIDSDDLYEAQDYVQLFIQNLEEYDIDPNCCRFYFSGSKGFHIMIPSGVFGATPDPLIHKRFRKIAEVLTKGIKTDMSIYNKTRIFRLPNTINGKSGLYKIELYPFQISNSDIQTILEQAKQPGERLEIEEEYDVSAELEEIFHAPIATKPTTAKTGDVDKYICMATVMKGVGEGERDNAAVRVASHLKKHGLNGDMIWVALDEWNKKNDPPLETHELERVYQQGFSEYDFGCHDSLMKKYCDPNCIFYKQHWGRF
ncbi:Primase C terminal 1 (PriCT-1) [Alteribacillus persepolensis]|uniref:Primase C terminal 1 (PriCT-1) n=1 Tax=Alteribacillus persepolensis TaxID=568899 RepID=A0A1G8I7Q0_9BACI|nr:primase C-terminal domain-containing protein [Alteribacillus persepolensis]SDI15009.1 Primase C terminal 1 (PriCT-1) [Alteribacillus persepolensis]